MLRSSEKASSGRKSDNLIVVFVVSLKELLFSYSDSESQDVISTRVTTTNIEDADIGDREDKCVTSVALIDRMASLVTEKNDTDVWWKEKIEGIANAQVASLILPLSKKMIGIEYDRMLHSILSTVSVTFT